ncbi:MAG TPA: tyrosine-type recombinase/integrase [Bacteroidales bacterium]|nr:tyrosine-type recombinase/integrase [Bacteroidales bacterium]
MEIVPQKIDQIATPNELTPIAIPKNAPDGLRVWANWYFDHAVTTAEISRKEQKRDLSLFIQYMELTEKTDERSRWTPRLAESFKDNMKRSLHEDGSRHWSDRTINRVLVHLKTFSKWVHGLRPFPLGNPMTKIKALPLTNSLEIERAISPGERRRLLDAADLLPVVGGRSKNRRFHTVKVRPRRKGYRPYRNRAMIYCLTETGMRRRAVTAVNLSDVDFGKKKITVEEKGGIRHTYQINKEGLAAIRDYIENERDADFEKWKSPALFLSPCTNPNGNGRLTVQVINDVWNDVCKAAGIKGKTPHSARHAMGRYIIEKTGNVAAVQRQLGHKNATYSMQYARITDEELNGVLDER